MHTTGKRGGGSLEQKLGIFIPMLQAVHVPSTFDQTPNPAE
jgi:hypothetical protein